MCSWLRATVQVILCTRVPPRKGGSQSEEGLSGCYSFAPDFLLSVPTAETQQVGRERAIKPLSEDNAHLCLLLVFIIYASELRAANMSGRVNADRGGLLKPTKLRH